MANLCKICMRKTIFYHFITSLLDKTQQKIDPWPLIKSGLDLNFISKVFIEIISGKHIFVPLVFAFDYNQKFTNSINSVALYKIFQFLMIAEGPFAQKWI